MSVTGSAAWRLRRLLAMTPHEVAVRAARASRDAVRRPRAAVPQDELAVLGDVLSSGSRDLSDEERLKAELDATRFRVFAGARDRLQLASDLALAGSPPDGTLAAAESVLDGRLPAFGWTVIDVGTETDWNRDPVSGKRWPPAYWPDVDFRGSTGLGDPRYVWEVNRHHHLVTLARASVLGGGDRFSEQAWRGMRSWIDGNPPYFGINWSSPLEIAIRLISWATVVDLLGSAGASAGDVSAVATSVALQAGHLSDNLSVYASSRNNHLIGEAVGLLVAGTKFPFLRCAEAWVARGSAVARREIAAQVTPRGVSREQTFHYGAFVLEFALLTLACLGRESDAVLLDRVSSMGGFIGAVGGTSGVPPSVGDEDGGRALELSDAGRERQCIRAAACASVLCRADLPRGASPPDLAPAAWLYGGEVVDQYLRDRSMRYRADRTGDGRLSAEGTAGAFVPGGYFVAGRDDHHGVVDCGPLGYLSIAAHGHADCLSVSLMYKGDWFLVDPGTYCYHRERKWRDHFRTTLAHNTVTVDGAAQSDMLGAFMWGRKARGFPTWWSVDGGLQMFEGRHDGYARTSNVVHTRSVVFVESGYWVIVDRLEGEGEHDLQATFQFADGHEVASGVPLVARGPRSEVSLWSSVPEGLTWRVAQGEESPPMGWISRGFGHRAPAPAALCEGRCRLPAVLVFGIVPEARHRGFHLRCRAVDSGELVEVTAGHELGEDRLLFGAGEPSSGEHFLGRLGAVLARGEDRSVLGMDVASWTQAGREVERRSVSSLI